MKNIVFELYETLSFKEKRKLFLIQVYNITVGFLELMGLALIIPYFNMISNLDQFYESYLIVLASNFININSMEINTILIILSALIISIFLFSTILTLYVNWQILLFSQNIGADFAKKLFKFYVYQDYKFHIKNDQSTIVAKLTSQINQVVGGIILSLMTIISR